jgi:hypothetical protein
MAKSVLQDLQREIQTVILGASNGEDPEPINLEFNGLKTF